MFNFLKKRISVPTAQAPKGSCPYCNVELDKFPTRKQKCKSCGKEFLVRTHYLTKGKIILTEKDASKYDEEKEKYYLDKSLIDGLKNYIDVDAKGIDKLIEKTQKELNMKFGSTASLGDVGWSVANQLLLDAMKKGDMGRLSSLYFQMALYLYDSGRDHREIQASSFEMNLQEYKKSKVVLKVEVLATDNSCGPCKALNAAQYTIQEAIDKKILPCRECVYQPNEKSGLGWCRCCYAPIV